MTTDTLDFSEMLDALVSARGAEWVADQIRVSACPAATTYEVECAQGEGDWISTGRLAVRELIGALYAADFPVRQAPPPAPPKPIKLRDCHRTGLFAEHTGIGPIVRDGLRLTVPVREALEQAGATVERTDTPDGPIYTVTLAQRMPTGIVAVTIHRSGQIGLRLAIEPEYPGEYPDQWVQIDWTPCPKCGAPLVWYEAGYAPGYRVCSRSPHHHIQA